MPVTIDAFKKMMLSNKMAVIATFSDPGHRQCYDCGYGHDCAIGNVYAQMGLTTVELAEENSSSRIWSRSAEGSQGNRQDVGVHSAGERVATGSVMCLASILVQTARSTCGESRVRAPVQQRET